MEVVEDRVEGFSDEWVGGSYQGCLWKSAKPEET